jgi:hypothetical protein
MIEVNKWWLGRRLIGKRVFMRDNNDGVLQDAGLIEQVDYWDCDVYTTNGWVGGPCYIPLTTFIAALFSRPAPQGLPSKALSQAIERAKEVRKEK